MDKNKSNQEEITCHQCGARLTFAPGTDSLKCEFCGAVNTIEVDETAKAEAQKEIDFYEFIKNKEETASKTVVLTIKCDGCGAETTFDPNVVSDRCDFCDSPLTAKEGHKTSLIAPKGILPFKVNDKEGIQLYQKWLKKLWFAPNKLKTYARQSEKLAGIYIPYWTYDANTYTHYSGRRGDDYQRTETYTNDEGKTEERTVTETRWSSVSGNVSRNFDDVLVPASNSLPTNYVDALEPWDLENIVPYDTKYLSGFKSETYQIGLEQGFDKAKVKMEDTIREDVRSDIGGDHQEISSLNTNYSDITFKHILLPIWLSAYRYNDKVYRFMINGRTGEVQGERPYSWIKITLFVLMIIAIIALIYYFTKGQA
jgi:LSD1 subclass zinc finger protein